MKRKLIIGTISAAVILGGALAAGATINDITTGDSQKSVNGKEMISAIEAEKVALSKVNGMVESVELDRNFGNSYYEVDIVKDNIDYDIYVEAFTGKILSVKDDRNDDRDDFVNETEVPNNSLLSREKAIEIAEKAVNGKVKEMDRDDEDGRMLYEFELITNKGEVGLEMDASTGKVLTVDYDD